MGLILKVLDVGGIPSMNSTTQARHLVYTRRRRPDSHSHRDYRPRGGMKRRMQSSRDDRRRMRPPPPPPPPPLLDPPRDLLLGPSYSDYLRDYSSRSMGMPMPPYPSQNYYDPLMPFPPSYPPAPPLSSHRLGDYPPPLSPPSSRRDKDRDHRDRDRGDRGDRRMRRSDHGRERSKRDHKDRRGRTSYDRHADECEEFLRRATSRPSASSGGYGSRHSSRR
ncbi:pre-mRNA 3'-end-processing factor FIP1-like [Lytechinus variegatus]|uniref:pre-mRNA 3'-end-processing factor FIP1-like n=1 Tax=Lytechinus variegatus TaxID=7654 RepID=UPI001BB29BAC|nr:pre-mRNA 3'-end-processing factor FIP1-like [Lytechinus variegatus]